jgi:hypothetical protein
MTQARSRGWKKTLNGSTNSPTSGVISLGSLARAPGLAVGVMSD